MAGIFGGGDQTQNDLNYDQLPYPNAPSYGGGGDASMLPYPNAPSYGAAGMGGDYG